jgi:hypothetical protein
MEAELLENDMWSVVIYTTLEETSERKLSRQL